MINLRRFEPQITHLNYLQQLCEMEQLQTQARICNEQCDKKELFPWGVVFACFAFVIGPI